MSRKTLMVLDAYRARARRLKTDVDAVIRTLGRVTA